MLVLLGLVVLAATSFHFPGRRHVALDAFAWDADSVDVNEWIRSSSEPLTADIAKFEAARERFLEAAKVDLGTG